MKNMKILAVAAMVSLAALSMVACQKNETEVKIERDTQGTGIGEYKGDKDSTTGGNQIQNTGDPIKDEASWPVGKFGYHEPPEELRIESINPLTKKPYSDRYSIHLHSDKYGDLMLNYNTKSGQRTLFQGNEERATGQLMIISGDNPISIEEALADLRIGDSIADNFGKKK